MSSRQSARGPRSAAPKIIANEAHPNKQITLEEREYFL
jgi:hypothetical protein